MNLITYLKEFKARKGHLVFSSTLITKIISFVLSAIVVRLLTQSEFGLITYARTIIFFIYPFMGFGLMHALLRFGSIKENRTERRTLYIHALKFGIAFSILLTTIVVIFAPYLTINLEGATFYLQLLALSIVFQTLFNIYSIYLRVMNLNKAYSKVSILFSVVSLVVTVIATFLLEGTGYILSLSIVPALTFVLVNKKKFGTYYDELIKRSRSINPDWTQIRYGLFVGVGSIASQGILMSDNLIIGNLVSDSKEVAIYRVGSLIPFNLLFIPAVFMTTDFTKIASEYNNKMFLKNYYKNYLKLFSIICLFGLGSSYILSGLIIEVVFGSQYGTSSSIFQILLLGLVGAFMFRIPLGNILNACGKASWNTYNAYMTLAFNLIVSIYLTHEYGIIGAAYGTAITFWFSGVVNIITFWYYLKSI